MSTPPRNPCIADTRSDNCGLSLCGRQIGGVLFTDEGRKLDSTEWVFLNIDHAFQAVQNGSILRPCKACADHVAQTFWENLNDL